MFSHRPLKYILLLTLLVTSVYSQDEVSAAVSQFDSQLLKLNVPEAFQRSSLKLEVFADSSWQLYRGKEALSFVESMTLLGQTEVLKDYEVHRQQEGRYLKDYRSRRVFAMSSVLGGGAYLLIAWSKGWVYHIPGYAALLVGGVRYLESRRIEVQALRERYYLNALISPARVQQLVDDYNFKLYQYLSNAGIHFSDH